MNDEFHKIHERGGKLLADNLRETGNDLEIAIGLLFKEMTFSRGGKHQEI